MEKKKIITGIGNCIDIDTEWNSPHFCIKELREFLEDAEKEGATNISISGTCWDGSIDDIEIQPIKIELESDDKFNERLKEEEFRKNNEAKVNRARERELYEQLKAKYENS